jgi:hypothetical protein
MPGPHKSCIVTLVSEKSAVICDMFSCSWACCKQSRIDRFNQDGSGIRLARAEAHLETHCEVLHVQIALPQLGDELLLLGHIEGRKLDRRRQLKSQLCRLLLRTLPCALRTLELREKYLPSHTRH